jgi:hypothetical protein
MSVLGIKLECELNKLSHSQPTSGQLPARCHSGLSFDKPRALSPVSDLDRANLSGAFNYWQMIIDLRSYGFQVNVKALIPKCLLEGSLVWSRKVSKRPRFWIVQYPSQCLQASRVFHQAFPHSRTQIDLGENIKGEPAFGKRI